MSPWSFENQMTAMQTVADHMGEWMRQAGVQETIMSIDALGQRVLVHTRALYRGQWVDNEVPAIIVREAIDLRAAMAQPGGGAWTKAHLTMKSDDYRLTTDFDYDAPPTLDPPYTPEDCAEDLRLHPRRPETVPAWMQPRSGS
ncbi:hypothetical protein [Actinomyces gerencseriae]|uniref:hypothetical protein n=1 Tax=Actinomyces gerencseriae TaxID=52769 RepID=UPI0003FD208C|nr:hypothetical protein [Actinomyces gerencseriae]